MCVLQTLWQMWKEPHMGVMVRYIMHMSLRHEIITLI